MNGVVAFGECCRLCGAGVWGKGGGEVERIKSEEELGGEVGFG